jgi:hypothetical protein
MFASNQPSAQSEKAIVIFPSFKRSSHLISSHLISSLPPHLNMPITKDSKKVSLSRSDNGSSADI